MPSGGQHKCNFLFVHCAALEPEAGQQCLVYAGLALLQLWPNNDVSPWKKRGLRPPFQALDSEPRTWR